MLQRTLLLFFAALYPAFWAIFKFTKMPIDDPRQRIVASILCLVVFKLYNSDNPKIRKYQNILTYSIYYIVTLHSLYLTYLNHFSVEFQLQNFIIIVFASLGFIRKYDLFYYLFFTLICFVPITVTGFTKLEIYFILCTLLLVCIGSFVIQNFHIRFLKQLLVNDKTLLRTVDRIKDGVIITDTTSHVLFVNDTAQKLLNFNSEFLVGSRVNLPIPSENRLTGDTTIIHTVEDRLVEIRMLKVERLGRPAFFIIIKDITQETRQKAETERLRLLHNSMLVFAKEGVVGLDKEGNITYINQYALDVTGYIESEVLGQSFHSTFHHSWMDGVPHEEDNSPIRETLLEGVVNRINNEIFWKKGDRYFYVEYVSSPIKKEEEITGAVVLFKDITDKKQQRDLENKYHEELLFLSESAMKFLQIKERSEIFEYIAGAIFEFSKPRAVIVNSYEEETCHFQVESANGFKQFMGSLVKIMNCEIIGAKFQMEKERYPQAFIQNKLIFLPDGLYAVNFGNLNRKECMVIESMLNVNRVYNFIFSDGGKILGSVIILYSEEKFPFETMLEIFLHQATIALNKE
ncbi:MAG: PAS domain-containing protein [Leptospiraceae bacterium]|nr:PAS domain-containing protein [Leptospiraceae bacterium]